MVEGVSFRHLEVNGLHMRIAEAGEGPLVLFVHGWPESWYSWRHQIPAIAVDHVTPHKGDEALFFDEDNWSPLCKPCHDGAKQEFEKSGTIRGCDVNGIPLDPAHPWNRGG